MNIVKYFTMTAATAALLGGAALSAYAGWPGDPAKCKPDAVKAGSVCMDAYEASVWGVPATNGSGKSNKSLIRKIQSGKVKLSDLTAGGATQYGLSGHDYPCADDGHDCVGQIYAVSIPGVLPSTNITWFQALDACANSRKRLPSNAEWQMAAEGTPDGSVGDNGTTDCNTYSVFTKVNTGSRSSCKSAWGAYDMTGNVDEWVADWGAQGTGCPGWGSFSTDSMCLAGASTTALGPGALFRGGYYTGSLSAGPLAIDGPDRVQHYFNTLGFRCAR